MMSWQRLIWTPSLQLNRGGASQLDDDDEKQSQKENRLVSVALFASYFTVMAAKCALPSTLPLLLSPTGGLLFPSSTTPQAHMARVLTLSTMTIAAGKLILGPVIDTVGGFTSLKVAISSLAVLLATIASTSHFLVFSPCWIFVDFIFSACWAACLHAVHQTFPSDRWSSQVGLLATAGRTGNAAAFAMFASVLGLASSSTATQGHGYSNSMWRWVFALSAVLQVIPLALLSWVTARRKNGSAMIVSDTESTSATPPRPSMLKSLRTLQMECTTRLTFWLQFASRSALMVFGSFLLFVPQYMNHAYGYTSSGASRVGSAYALGCLLAVTVGAAPYARWKRRHKLWTIGTTLSLATLMALLQVAHVSTRSPHIQLTPSLGAISMFVWGLSFALPFYLPPSLYALRRGASSATIADAFDVGGFGLLAWFNGYVASVEHGKLEAWTSTFVLLAACAFTSLVSLFTAILTDADEDM